MSKRRILITAMMAAVWLGGGTALAADPTPAAGGAGVGLTPPRLSYLHGQVSFWRPGANDWTAAQVNTPLAPGDTLSTGSPGDLEVQVGSRDFVRAWADTQVGLENQEPDYLQLKVTAGHVALDLRSLDPAHTVEVDTPNGAFTIERPGYYRLDVTQDRTSFITRRGGRASLIPITGQPAGVAPSEQVVVTGTTLPSVATYVAPELDDWDRWNYARTDQLLDSASNRYVSPGTYGVDDLDTHGTWRVVPTYGPVWIPEAVPSGWAPYTTGSWIWDPYYGWTWVDRTPWGWAPFHHGRWVFVNGFWAWAPGPVVAVPAYAPALVAFFGGGGGVSIGVGGPISWVALGWGEPVVPWWGRPGFIGVPWWGRWGGPRIVNNVVINRTTVVNVKNITVYRNVSVQNAVVRVRSEHFGRGPLQVTRLTRGEMEHLQPLHGALGLTPEPRSLAPAAAQGVKPPDRDLRRPVVATRAPRDPETWLRPHGITVSPTSPTTPPARLVPKPQGAQPALTSPRPPFGPSTAERPRRRPENAAPAPAPSQLAAPSPPAASRPEREPRAEARPTPPASRQGPGEPQARTPAPPREGGRGESARRPARPLPGEPANRLFPGQSEMRPQGRGPERSAGTPSARGTPRPQEGRGDRGGRPFSRGDNRDTRPGQERR